MFSIYYNCFYWLFIFFSTLNIANNGRTRLPSASWQVLGWIHPRGSQRLVGPKVTEEKLCPRADVCILQQSWGSISWVLQRYTLFTPHKFLWLVGLGCCSTAHQITPTRSCLEFKIDFVWHVIKVIHAFYRKYYWSVLGFAHTHIEIASPVRSRVEMMGWIVKKSTFKPSALRPQTGPLKGPWLMSRHVFWVSQGNITLHLILPDYNDRKAVQLDTEASSGFGNPLEPLRHSDDM